MPTPDQITGKIIFFAELRIGGKVYRFCTDPVIELTDSDANAYTFDLPFDFEEWAEEALPFMDGLPTRTVGISLQMGSEIDYIIGLGLQISAGEMTLYRGYEGNLDHDSLISLFTGRVDDWMILTDGTFAFNLYNDEINRSKFLDPDLEINDETFPNYTIPDGSFGVPYPIVIGSPGYGIDGVFSGVQAGAIAINANWDETISGTNPEDLRYIVAGHRVNGTQVFARSGNGEFDTDYYDILEDQDENGVTYSYIDFTGVFDLKENTNVFIGFSEESAGMPGINGLGDFIASFLQNTGKRFNWDKIFAIREDLNQYKIDTQILDNPQVWDWTFQNVLSYLPISYLEDGDGLYFLLWNFEADSRVTLEADKDIFRIEDSGFSGSSFGDVCNEIIVRAAKNSRTGSYAIRAKASGNKDKSYADPRLVISRELYGPRELEINLDHISDKNTASMILQAAIQRYGLPFGILEYTSDIDLDYLEIGDVVYIEDSTYNISQNAFISGKIARPESLQFKFMLFQQY